MKTRCLPFEWLRWAGALAAITLWCGCSSTARGPEVSPATALSSRQQGQARVVKVTGQAEALAPTPSIAPPPSAPTTPAPPTAPATAQAAAPQPASVTFKPGEWVTLFDGQTMAGWKVTDFAGRGETQIADGAIVVGAGAVLSGVTYTNPVPRQHFEVDLEAKKTEGSDFFCGLTVPYGDSHFSLIVGGWGGGVVGISSIDSNDAASNETTKYMAFERNRWYRIRLKVTERRLEAWINDDKMVEVDVAGRRVSMRPGEIETAIPLSVSTYQTGVALRAIRLRVLADE